MTLARLDNIFVVSRGTGQKDKLELDFRWKKLADYGFLASRQKTKNCPGENFLIGHHLSEHDMKMKTREK